MGTGVGVGVGAATCTVLNKLVLPPGPLQLSVKVLVIVRLVRVSLLATALVPLHAPDAAQVVVLVLVQDNTLVPPDATLVGLALKVMVGNVPPPPTAVTTMVAALLTPPQFKL